MGVGATCGAFNGFFIGIIGMRAFLTTLVTLIIYRSIVDLLLLEYALDISSVSQTLNYGSISEMVTHMAYLLF